MTAQVRSSVGLELNLFFKSRLILGNSISYRVLGPYDPRFVF